MLDMIRVLLSPTATFERLREKKGAEWIAALIVLMLCSLLSAWLLWPIIEHGVVENFQKQGLADSALHTGLMIGKISAFVGAPLTTAGMLFIYGLFLLLVNLVVRGDAKYLQLVIVAVYASVPTALSGILTGLLLRTSGATSQTDVSISLAAFMTKKSGYLYAISSQINPFSIWSLMLLIIGTAVMSRKAKSSVGLWIVLGWVILTLIVSLAGLLQQPAA